MCLEGTVARDVRLGGDQELLLTRLLQMTNHSFIIRKVNDEYDSRGHTKVLIPPSIQSHAR